MKKIFLYLFLIIGILILAFAVWFSFGKYQQKKQIENLKKQIQSRWGQTIPNSDLKF